MAEAYIVDAIRTPTGRRNGGLSQAHPADMGAHVISELIKRNDFDAAAVEDVVFGCLDTIGPQAGDIARTCWLAAGLPESVPGVTIDRQCGSSQQAVHFAAMGVMSGVQDIVVAGGTQNMSMIPIGSSWTIAKELGHATPFEHSKGWTERYGKTPVNQFYGAEQIANQWNISREDMEEFAYNSHQRALRAIDEGRFEREITAYGDVTTDEGPRRNTTLEKMATLKVLFPG
ncbi:MAG: acetyl-CoA C-acetyltransferase, partial [Myxococcota bacterium]